MMKKERPLYLRLYTEPHLIALVRLIGYDGKPVAEVKKQMRLLVEQHGKERMRRAAGQLVRIDAAGDPPFARLTEPVRRLAWQLLGPPPEAGAVPEVHYFGSPEARG